MHNQYSAMRWELEKRTIVLEQLHLSGVKYSHIVVRSLVDGSPRTLWHFQEYCLGCICAFTRWKMTCQCTHKMESQLVDGPQTNARTSYVQEESYCQEL